MNTNAEFTNRFGNNVVANALPTERAAFIRKTYAHLALTILVFSGIVSYLVGTGRGVWIAESMLNVSWLLVLVLFMGISWIAQTWARSDTSKFMQYMGLILFTVAWSIIFLPLLFMATYYADEGIVTILKAGVITLGLFLGLTSVVLLTRKDFSFLGPILMVGFFIALGFIVSGVVFGFSLGNIFAFAMVAFAGGSILYETSNMLHHYRTDQYVAASLGLFASIALLFWYILQIFMGRD